jgi:hypothetical protein
VESFKSLVRVRVKKQNKMIFGYFWSAFALQNILYGLLCFVLIQYGYQPLIFILCLAGILITLPFTVYMMKRYKQLAKGKLNRDSDASIYDYVRRQRDLLLDFFKFKKSYEIMLVPLSSAIGVVLTFELFVPGGVLEYAQGAMIAFVLTFLSCMFAIRSENQKNFIRPLEDLQDILDEYLDDSIKAADQ